MRFVSSILIAGALVAFVGSFAPVALADSSRLALRLAGFASLALGYAAWEAAGMIARRSPVSRPSRFLAALRGIAGAHKRRRHARAVSAARRRVRIVRRATFNGSK